MYQEISTTQITRDGNPIYIHSWSNNVPERVLVCIQGLGGHGGYYDVLAEALCHQGTAVVAPDLRGHGESHGTRGDVSNFEVYLRDVDCAIIWAKARWPDLPIFLLGESMGSSIAIGSITTIDQDQTKAKITGLILVSPVLRAIVQPSLREVWRGTQALLTPTRPLIAVTGHEDQGCREPSFNERLRADPLFIRHVSMRFLFTITNWLKQMQKRARQVTLPLLVMQGERDYIAHPAGSRQFLSNVGSQDVENKIFSDAYHCLFHDPVTPSVLHTLSTWLSKHS
jgi:alpha-beta hydrolase superfamily lysophospholipase